MLERPVSIQSLAAFRILFGLLIFWDVLRSVQHDRITRYYVVPDMTFTYAGFSWVQPLPEPWIHLAWAAVGFFALMVALGLMYRVAIIGLVLSFGYFFLLDKAQYLNHFYLILLYALLLCVLPAHRAFSIDVRLRPQLARRHVPYAAIFVLRAQIEIVLVFAGIVKIGEDWLRGAPLIGWLRGAVVDGPAALTFLLSHDWVIVASAWGVVVLHLVGAPLLLWTRTRLPVFVIYVVFHLANGYFFNIGIFPYVAIAATLIVFEPDWPQRAARWLLGWFEPLPPLKDVRPSTGGALPALTLAALTAWLTIQVALPLRPVAFPTEVRWSGEGHRFAWRMRLYSREGRGYFLVRSPVGDEWIVDPSDFLTQRQRHAMMARADMIWQFARHLERHWEDAGHADVAVHAYIEKSLNGRPFQPFIDPRVDLTAVSPSILHSDPWILPMADDFGERSGRPPEGEVGVGGGQTADQQPVP